ncbi:hypothetical protein BDF19DRAFT_425886 [Syncephalis fuscata]|nr:hypothetical protein BDF19DRAFT_425886 [Syncephalis fuscata]
MSELPTRISCPTTTTAATTTSNLTNSNKNASNDGSGSSNNNDNSPSTTPDTLVWTAPTKRIHNQVDMATWQQSEAYTRLLHFIKQLNTCALNRRISDPCEESTMLLRLVSLLDELDTWIDDFPPLPTPQRFGNKAFRSFITRLEERSVSLLADVLPSSLSPALDDLVAYFTTSFGNGTRIDYGSGHELAFVAWLCCLRGIGLLEEKDEIAIVMRLFTRYLRLVRRLQKDYSLEPAGSHGVWGLDDFQFLPYYWGSAQLRDQSVYRPLSILNKSMVDEGADDYMYFDCIRVIHTVKSGPFHEHSPVLNDIAMVPTWSKVNIGMLRMYQAEVLGKFPVVQHLPFGTLLPFTLVKKM